MLLRRFLAAMVALAFVLSIFSISSFAGNDEKADKTGKASWTWTDEQGPAKVGAPVKWTRTVAITNDGEKEKKINIKNFPRNTQFAQNNLNLEYHKKNVKYVAPVGTSTVVIDYATPAPTSKITVTANNATHYLFDFVIDADTDVHYTDVDMPVDVPGLTWDWNYFFNWKQPDGSFSQQRLYAASTDGDRETYEKIGWKAPHLSEQAGQGGGQKSQSKIRNYDLETARGNNASLPDLWYFRDLLGTQLEDNLNWDWAPLDSGRGSQTGLKIKRSQLPNGFIYAEPINGTGTNFTISFVYKPSFSQVAEEYCYFWGGMEILFGDGSSDTTYPFGIGSDGTIAISPGEFVTSTKNLASSWVRVNLNSTMDVPSDRYLRFYFYTDSCNEAPNNYFILDDVLIN